MRDYALCFALILSLALVSRATVYYVDPVNGNDSNDGKSTALAWATLGGFKFAGLSPGDIVYARGGNYGNGANHIHSGTFSTPSWDEPITLAAYPGETPVIIGDAIDNTFFNLFDVRWIIDGFRFEAEGTAGFWIYLTNAHHSIVRNCYFGPTTSISTTVVNSNYVTFENNTFTHSGIFDFGTYQYAYNNISVFLIIRQRALLTLRSKAVHIP